MIRVRINTTKDVKKQLSNERNISMGTRDGWLELP